MDVIEEFVKELEKKDLDTYLACKMILLAHTASNPRMNEFLRKAFQIVEARKCVLIEMKNM